MCAVCRRTCQRFVWRHRTERWCLLRSKTTVWTGSKNCVTARFRWERRKKLTSAVFIVSTLVTVKAEQAISRQYANFVASKSVCIQCLVCGHSLLIYTNWVLHSLLTLSLSEALIGVIWRRTRFMHQQTKVKLLSSPLLHHLYFCSPPVTNSH